MNIDPDMMHDHKAESALYDKMCLENLENSYNKMLSYRRETALQGAL